MPPTRRSKRASSDDGPEQVFVLFIKEDPGFGAAFLIDKVLLGDSGIGMLRDWARGNLDFKQNKDHLFFAWRFDQLPETSSFEPLAGAQKFESINGSDVLDFENGPHELDSNGARVKFFFIHTR